MARAKSGGRTRAVPPGLAEDSSPITGRTAGEANRPARIAPPPEVQEADFQSTDSPRRGLKAETKRRLAVIRRSSALGAELRLRQHLRQEILEDVIAFLRTLMDAGAEQPEKFGELGFSAAKLILDKLTGFPQAPYDEQESLGVALVESNTIEREAEKVTKELASRPLQSYLDIVRRGALPPAEQT